ncbi:hypothetical protein AB0F77_22550 [Streptomyces sp. NPDC026672]|uniref:hypothetical protein n=1 Tax=unclassified Streptomyces TaxID=2593676 RepID=UPI003409D70E
MLEAEAVVVPMQSGARAHGYRRWGGPADASSHASVQRQAVTSRHSYRTPSKGRSFGLGDAVGVTEPLGQEDHRGGLVHVDRGPDARLVPCLAKEDGRFRQARENRVTEVGAGDTLRDEGHAAEIVKVAHDHFGAYGTGGHRLTGHPWQAPPQQVSICPG